MVCWLHYPLSYWVSHVSRTTAEQPSQSRESTHVTDSEVAPWVVVYTQRTCPHFYHENAFIISPFFPRRTRRIEWPIF